MRWKPLLFWILLSHAAGLIGLPFTNVTYYQTLQTPPLSPHPNLFAPVWGLLYTLMGIAAYRITIERDKRGMQLFTTQLLLNAAWTPVFFGLQAPLIAATILLLLMITLTMTIKQFYQTDKTASYLLLPYWLWAGFALYLNLGIVALN